MNPDLIHLAMALAHEVAEADIESFCMWVSNDDDGPNSREYDLDGHDKSNEFEHTMVTRAERFLDLAGRLERRQDNPRIVRIKPIEVQS